MKHLKEYRKGSPLSEEELDETTTELLYAKFKEEQRGVWENLIEQKHNMRRMEQAPRRINRWMTRIAAAVILALCVAIPIRRMLFSSDAPSAHLIAEYIDEPFDNITTRKNITIDVSDFRIRATNAYNKENYAEAIEAYEQIIKDEAATTEDYLYLGLSALYSDKSSLAAQYLQEANDRAKKEERYEAETSWFSALAYLQNNQSNKAYPILESIVKDEAWQAENAKILLLSIDALED